MQDFKPFVFLLFFLAFISASLSANPLDSSAAVIADSTSL
jgi:hypothetical protein